MSTLIPTDERHQDASNDESELIKIPVVDLIAAVYRRRRWLAKVTGIGVLASVGLALLAFLIPNPYSSTAGCCHRIRRHFPMYHC